MLKNLLWLVLPALVAASSRQRRAVTCTCLNGDPKTDCDQDTDVNCDTCNTGFHLEVNSTTLSTGDQGDDCIQNICTCTNGSEKVGTGCEEDNLHSCDTCDPGYVIEDIDGRDLSNTRTGTVGATCIEIVCPCQKGTGVAGGNCTDDSINNCASCDNGYELSLEGVAGTNKTCDALECECTDGTAIDVKDWWKCENRKANDPTKSKKTVCKECDDYYHIDDTSCSDCLNSHKNKGWGLCERNVCDCGPGGGAGTDATNCTVHEANECEACDDAWNRVDELQGFTCQPNICNCTNGDPHEYPTSQGCTSHGANMCRQCDKFYHLEGDDCVENQCACDYGGQTVGQIVDNSTCLVHGGDQCVDCLTLPHYHLESEDITYELKGVNYTETIDACEMNVCSCPGGSVIANECHIHNNTECDWGTCSQFHHEVNSTITVNGSTETIMVCTENSCVCDNGIAVDNSTCLGNGSNQCDSCIGNYHVNATSLDCEENVCDCLNGVTVANENCTVNGGDQCLSCDPLYRLSTNTTGDACVTNTCTCPGGQVNSTLCVADGLEVCESCDDAHFKLEDAADAFGNLRCVQKECLCNNGTEATGSNCTIHNSETCVACDTFYNLNVDLCEYNTCNCAAGTPHGDGECLVNGATECKNCTDIGYRVDATFQCVPKDCTCENGTAKSGGDCTVQDANQCDSCNPLFHMDVDGITCIANECQCNNGIPVDNSTCVDYLVEQCDSCDQFYHLNTTTNLCDVNVCDCQTWDSEDGYQIFDYGVGRGANNNTNYTCETHGASACDSCGASGTFGEWWHVVDESNGYTNTSDEAWLTCQPNVCWCENGEPKDRFACPEHTPPDGGPNSGISTGHKCDSCSDPNMTLDDNLHCINKVCTCPNGLGQDDGSCNDSFFDNCKSCDEGYQNYTDYTMVASVNTTVQLCQPNACTCANGTPRSGGSCLVPGAEECVSCDEGYSYNSTTLLCDVNTCTCTNGVGATNGDCVVDGAEECASCNYFYKLNSTLNNAAADNQTELCIPNVCTCALGSPVNDGECFEDGTDQCSNCTDTLTYYLQYYNYFTDNTNTTIVKLPNSCETLSADRCLVTGPTGCVECAEFHHLNVSGLATTCEQNVCVCPLGTAVSNNECIYHESTQCTADSCTDVGYFVDRYERCMPKECSCENGQGVHDGTCVDTNMNRCMSCDSGFTLGWKQTEFYKELNISRWDYNGSTSFMAEYCVPLNCTTGFHEDGNECSKNVCSCPNGEVSTCPVNDLSVIHCDHCHNGYSLVSLNDNVNGIDRFECINSNDPVAQASIKTCNCEYGIPAVGNDCPNAGDEYCVSCYSPGYSVDPVDNTCKATVCSCSNGEPVADGTCVDKNTNRCAACNPGYTLELVFPNGDDYYEEHCVAISACPANQHHAILDNGEKGCADNICFCPNGSPESPCSQHEAFICDSCLSAEYELIEHASNHKICQKIAQVASASTPIVNANTCFCTYGEPATGADCLNDGDHICDSCHHEGYKVDGNKHCVAKVCRCDNGIGVADGTCMDESDKRCVFCDDGYEKVYQMDADGVHYHEHCLLPGAPTPVTSPPTVVTTPVTSPPTVVTTPVTSPPTVVTTPVTSPPTVVTTPVTSPPTVVTTPVTSPPTVVTTPVTSPPTVVTTPVTSPVDCFCDNGIKKVGKKCANGDHICESCNAGYVKNKTTKQCDQIQNQMLIPDASKEKDKETFKSIQVPDNGEEFCLGGDEKNLSLMACDEASVLEVWYVEQDGKVYTKVAGKSTKRCIKFDSDTSLVSVTSCQKVGKYSVVMNDDGLDVLATEAGEIITV